MLPQSRQEHDPRTARGNRALQAIEVVREGYKVSRTRENTLFNMLASFTVTFGITRWITWTIREKGGLGPIKNVIVGTRHIHHFIPGGLLSLAAGGVAIGAKGSELDRYLAVPFGVGVALVLDESALLLELEDVYWTEEGVLSVQIVVRRDRHAGRDGLPDPDAAPQRGAGLRGRLGDGRQGLGRPAGPARGLGRPGDRAMSTPTLPRPRRRRTARARA